MFISSLFLFHFLFHFSFHSHHSKPVSAANYIYLSMKRSISISFQKCFSNTSLPNKTALPKTNASKRLGHVGSLSDLTPIVSRSNTTHFDGTDTSSYFWRVSLCVEPKPSPSCLQGWLNFHMIFWPRNSSNTQMRTSYFTGLQMRASAQHRTPCRSRSVPTGHAGSTTTTLKPKGAL